MAIIFDIACIGTSLTAGTGNNGAGGLPYGSFIPELVKALSPGKQSHIRIYNLGIAGGLSSDSLSTSLPIALNLKPKAVFIENLMNDCLGAGSGGLSTSSTSTNNTSIITSLKALPNPPAIYLVTMNPVAGAGAAATARSNLATYNAVYSTLAGSQSVNLIDCFTAWGAGNTTDIPDGVHPTLAANIAKLIPTMVSAITGSIT
jgi:lysophospholipase L1-like esterase